MCAPDDEVRARGLPRRRPRRRDQHRRARTRPAQAPIWYGYQPGGELWIVTERDSRKGRLLRRRALQPLRADRTAALQVRERRGPVTSIVPSDVERDRRPLAHRYLGRDLGDRYIAVDRRRGVGLRAHPRLAAPRALAHDGLREAVRRRLASRSPEPRMHPRSSADRRSRLPELRRAGAALLPARARGAAARADRRRRRRGAAPSSRSAPELDRPLGAERDRRARGGLLGRAARADSRSARSGARTSRSPTLAPRLAGWTRELLRRPRLPALRGLPVARWGDEHVSARLLGPRPAPRNAGRAESRRASCSATSSTRARRRRIRTCAATARRATSASTAISPTPSVCSACAPRAGRREPDRELRLGPQRDPRARPDLAERLYEPFLLDSRDEEREGARRGSRFRPAATRAGACDVLAQRLFPLRDPTRGRGTLHGARGRAARSLRGARGLAGAALDMQFEPGDVQLISNHTVVHARTAYEDDPGSERHLLRLWLSCWRKPAHHPGRRRRGVRLRRALRRRRHADRDGAAGRRGLCRARARARRALSAARLDDAFARILAQAPPRVFPDAPAAAIAELERDWWRGVVRSTFLAADGTARFADFEVFFDGALRALRDAGGLARAARCARRRSRRCARGASPPAGLELRRPPARDPRRARPRGSARRGVAARRSARGQARSAHLRARAGAPRRPAARPLLSSATTPSATSRGARARRARGDRRRRALLLSTLSRRGCAPGGEDPA